MRLLNRTVIWTGLVLFLIGVCSAPASAQDGIKQYRAAVTKVFVWQHHAFPVFSLNPVFPGSVVQLSNEGVYFVPERCYSDPQYGQYRRITDFIEGVAIAIDADSQLKGVLLSKHLAEIQAKAGVRLEALKRIEVSPLSRDDFRPDLAALRNIKPSPECQLIPQLLDGTKGGYVVAAGVLHGQVRYRLEVRWRANLDAAIRSDVLARIAKAFVLQEAELKTTTDGVSFTVVASPGPQTLAIIPAKLNVEELARITYFLQGQTGAQLETSVQEAVTARDAGVYQKAANRVREFLGNEIKNKERWAENFVSGKELVTISQLRNDYQNKVDMAKVATYAAAMELIR
jgi:hypothetical protein